MPNYYLALISSLTWQEFLDAGGEIYGTTKNKENRAKKLKSGDKLLCYISKVGTFAGVLEIQLESYLDNSPVWKDADYPIRFKVKTLVFLEPDLGITVKSLFDDLTIFTRLNSLKGWQGFFQNALNQFPEEDGKLIEQKLMKLKKK